MCLSVAHLERQSTRGERAAGASNIGDGAEVQGTDVCGFARAGWICLAAVLGGWNLPVVDAIPLSGGVVGCCKSDPRRMFLQKKC